MKSETKLKKVKAILDELPLHAYAVFDFNKESFVRESTHCFLISEIKKIKKILEMK